MVQQLAYSLAHVMNILISVINQPIVIQVAVGTNFFEIAKLRALRLLNLVAKDTTDLECHLLVSPTKRNKTSMIITSTCYILECMSAIIGEPMQSQIYHTILCIIRQ
jgi:methylmalonyl-CoA mutase